MAGSTFPIEIPMNDVDVRGKRPRLQCCAARRDSRDSDSIISTPFLLGLLIGTIVMALVIMAV